MNAEVVNRSRKKAKAGELRVGTSGWHYKGWWGPFYPDGVKKKDALRYYASRLNAAELNAPFYRTPTPEAVRGWFEQTPEEFRFTWKASKFITHWKRLSEKSDNSLELMETRLSVLRHKLGPVLFQLPPKMAANRERLASFLEMLNPSRRYSFEFRHPSWYEPSILKLLRNHDIFALHLRSRRRACAARGYGELDLCPQSRPERPLSRQLLGRGACRLGARHPLLAEREPRRVVLLRQRCQERGSGGCRQASRPAR